MPDDTATRLVEAVEQASVEEAAQWCGTNPGPWVGHA